MFCFGMPVSGRGLFRVDHDLVAQARQQDPYTDPLRTLRHKMARSCTRGRRPGGSVNFWVIRHQSSIPYARIPLIAPPRKCVSAPLPAACDVAILC